MADMHNIFISHYGEDEKALDSLTMGVMCATVQWRKRSTVPTRLLMPPLLAIFACASVGPRPSL